MAAAKINLGCLKLVSLKRNRERERISEGEEYFDADNGGVGEETDRNCFDPAIEILRKSHDELPQNHPLKKPIKTMLLDLRFFKMFLWSLEYWDDDSGNDLHLHFLSDITSMRNELREAVMECWKEAKDDLHLSSHCVGKFEQLKSQVRESCIAFLGGAFKCKSFKNVELSKYARDEVDFFLFIRENLEILRSTVGLTTTVKQQIRFIKKKLNLFGNFVDLVSEWISGDTEPNEFLLHTKTWVNHISCLSCLYWIDGMKESFGSTVTSDLMQITMPHTPKVIALYLGVLVATRNQKFKIVRRHELDLLGARYVDFLLENLEIPVEKDVEMLPEGIMFLLTFLMDPPNDSEDSELLYSYIGAIMSQVPFFISSIHFSKEEIPLSKTLFPEFIEKIERVKAEVGEAFVLIMDSSQLNSPMTNAIGFLDFLLGNLQKMLEVQVNFIPSVTHRVNVVREELASLMHFLQSIMELQKEHEEFKDLWTRVIYLVYNADYVAKLTSVIDVPVWYSLTCLSSVIETLKLIKDEVKQIEDHPKFKSKRLSAKMKSHDVLSTQAMTSKIEGAFIGFKEDVRSLMDHLVRGRNDLTIISISGMPGQGKTTIAKRIYNDPLVRYHFHKIVWSHVSKECTMRKLLIKMVHDVSNKDYEPILKLENQDLAECLRKSLKRQRYLIVMDDIWDDEVWHNVQGSFPDDKNGSRILFTTRNHNLILEAKPNSISHRLRLFSEEESWELMKEKLWSDVSDAPEFLEIGKRIAIYCKGLPLAVVLVAALLRRTEQNLDMWSQVAENLKSRLAIEGCMHIIELSYKYLPEHLKPCFLYFAAFPRARNIRARKLKQLWIAEGFTKENEMQGSEDAANEYLDYLVCQNLVVATERCSRGGIKTCNVHDLLYDLCLEKAVEENFLYFADTRTAVDQCPSKYNHHRLCISKSDPYTNARPICTRKALPTSLVHSIVWFRDDSWKQIGPYFMFPPFFLESFKVLTALDLEDVHFLLQEIPKAIMSMVHLRYLAIWASFIDHVPPSIADLWNLQIFILREPRSEVKLPATILKKKSLRHVHISSCRLYFEDLDLNKSSAAAYSNLEALGAPILDHDPETREFLRSSPRLRKLSCCFGEGFSPIWFSMFTSLNKLESLKIGYLGCFFPDINPENFPGFNFPGNLKKLTLSSFNLPWSAVSTLGKMPNLEVLKLLDEACKGTKWDLEEEEFSKLRYLKFCGLEIEQLSASSESFPCLEELVVEDCFELEEIPSSFGGICTLKTIKLLGFHKAADSVRRIQEEQRDMGNHRFEVLIII